MDVPQDNPAGRLHRVLVSIQEQEGGMQIHEALFAALGLEDADGLAVLHQYVAEMAAWPGEAETLVRLIPDQNHDLLLWWVPKVEEAMEWVGRWGHTVNNVQNMYDPHTLYSLAVTADLLHRFKPEPTLDEDKLPDLIDLVRQIIDEVSEDENLSPFARAFLVGHLEEVHKALVHFRIVGYSGVADAMDQLLGATVRTPEVPDGPTIGWMVRIWERIRAASIGTKQISEGASAAIKAIEAGKDIFGG